MADITILFPREEQDCLLCPLWRTKEDFVLVAHVLALDLLDSEEFLSVVQGDEACISKWLDPQDYD